MEALQKKMQSEVEKMQNIQRDMQKHVSAHQQLSGQLTENENVKEELGLVDDSNTVFKLIGPVLVKQDIVESRCNVDKRIDYIKGEIKRHEGMIKDLETKQESQKESLTKLQQQYQQAQTKMAGRS